MRERVEQMASRVIGAAIEVHRELGAGFLERIYHEALCEECRRRDIPVETEVALPVCYKGEKLGHGRVDLLVGNCLLVELKTVDAFHPIHTAQVPSYLKAGDLPLGLLLNFRLPRLKDGGIKRVIDSQPAP